MMREDSKKEWLECLPIGEIINDTFLPIKTPMSERFSLPPNESFTPNKYYDPREFHYYGLRTEHIYCRGHDGPPTRHNCEKFVNICQAFISAYPNQLIAVHCTHGHNRTGYMICYFLCKIRGWSVDDAISQFARVREPGIKKLDYKMGLYRRFDHKSRTRRAEEPEYERKRSYRWSQTSTRSELDPWWREKPSTGSNSNSYQRRS